MRQTLRDILEELKNRCKLHTLRDAELKQSVLLRILSALGWDIFNPDVVRLGYRLGRSVVDYALLDGDGVVVLINIYRQRVKLQSQLADLVRLGSRSGARRVVLTDGICWWIIAPDGRRSLVGKTTYTINLYDQSLEEVHNRFRELLSSERLLGAKEEGERPTSGVDEALFEAWRALLDTPDMRLVELLADTVERQRGYRPDYADVLRFVEGLPEKGKIQRSLPPQQASSFSPPPSYFKGKKIEAFVFDGQRYEVRFWKDFLCTLARVLKEKHPDAFEKVLLLRGKKRPYFSRRPSDLRIPELIEGTDIYVETNQSASSIVQLCRELVRLFGYREEDLQIEVQGEG